MKHQKLQEFVISIMQNILQAKVREFFEKCLRREMEIFPIRAEIIDLDVERLTKGVDIKKKYGIIKVQKRKGKENDKREKNK